MRGTGKWLVKPRQQILVVLPTLVGTVLAAALGYVLISVTRFAGYNALQQQGADERVVNVFLADTLIFLIVFGGGVLALLIGAVLWAGWLSVRVFGPVSRLERGLTDALNGDKKPFSVGVRKSDMLYGVFELFDKFLSRR